MVNIKFEIISIGWRNKQVWIMIVVFLTSVTVATWFIAKILKHHEMIHNFHELEAELNVFFFFGILCFQGITLYHLK